MAEWLWAIFTALLLLSVLEHLSSNHDTLSACGEGSAAASENVFYFWSVCSTGPRLPFSTLACLNHHRDAGIRVPFPMSLRSPSPVALGEADPPL